MSARLPSLPKSKKGFWGTLLFFYAAVRIILDFWQGADFAADNAGSLVDYVATGPGNLVALIIGVLLIVWAIYSRHSQGESTKDVSAAESENAAVQPATEPESERLRVENEELRADNAALQKELASRDDASKSYEATITQEDSAAVITRITAERDELREELESRKADAGFRGKALDMTKKMDLDFAPSEEIEHCPMEWVPFGKRKKS